MIVSEALAVNNGLCHVFRTETQSIKIVILIILISGLFIYCSAKMSMLKFHCGVQKRYLFCIMFQGKADVRMKVTEILVECSKYSFPWVQIRKL